LEEEKEKEMDKKPAKVEALPVMSSDINPIADIE
jgi:hypothetical protein